MSESSSVISEYLTGKRSHRRKKVSDTGDKAFEAVEIATRVLRLHYPERQVRGVRCYFDNTPIEPFLAPEHLTTKGPADNTRKEHIVVDVYFVFGGAVYPSKSEEDAFVVEVVFPKCAERVRWQGLVRVRWADLGWKKHGNHQGDNPVPNLAGETFVNLWS
jgi:hypothetical protein